MRFLDFLHYVIVNIGLFPQTWGPMEEAYLSWILSSGLSGVHKLIASNLKHKDFCFRHLQVLFVEGNLVRQLHLLFVFFWLTALYFYML